MTRPLHAAPHDINFMGMLAPALPSPLLYVSTRDERARDYLIPVVKRFGLPIMSIQGDPQAANLLITPAEGEEWAVVLGPGKALTVTWPAGPPLVYGGTLSTPGWREPALSTGECLLVVGPPPVPGDDLHQMFSRVWEAGGALGLVRVRLHKHGGDRREDSLSVLQEDV